MKKNKLYIVKILLQAVILMFAAAGCVEFSNEKVHSNVEEIIDLSGQWKFSIGDHAQWSKADFVDTDWEVIKVPSSWENQGFHGYNGYAWYRKSFKFPFDVSENNIYLHLGYIDDVDAVYFNGQLIGRSGGFLPYYYTAYNAYRKYYVPSNLINTKGENIIAVRVFDAELDGGIVSGEIGLFRAESGLSPDIFLNGEWRFYIGDNMSWKEKDYDHSEWSQIFVPTHWEAQGYMDYDGFAWYRKSFTINKQLAKEKLILLLGKIDDVDQTFINGKFVGSTGIWQGNEIPSSFNQNNEYLELRTYFIPDGLLNETGENVVAVRVYDGFRDGGIYEGPIGLITQKRYREYWQSKRN